MREFKTPSIWKHYWMLAVLVGLFAFPSVAAAAPKYEGAIELSSTQLPDGRRELKAVVTGAKGDTKLPVENVSVDFYQLVEVEKAEAVEEPEAPAGDAAEGAEEEATEEAAEPADGAEGEEEAAEGAEEGAEEAVEAEPEFKKVELGTVATDAKGEAVHIIDKDADVELDADGNMTFLTEAKFNGAPVFEAKVKVQRATLELSTAEKAPEPEEEDAAEGEEEAPEDAKEAAGEGEDKEAEPEKKRLVQAKIMKGPEGSEEPLASVQVKFAVIRSFGNIPFGGDFTFTDEEGKVSAEFPEGIPQNADGKVEVLVSIEGHDDIGTVTNQIEVPWGEPRAGDDRPKRALWAARAAAPWWLIITANTLLLGVWGMILYVLSLVNGIRKDAKGEL